jgi:hypothetical protein
VQRWTTGECECFQRTSLKELGHILDLRPQHLEESISPEETHFDLKVLHTNGIHEIRVRRLRDIEPWVQLIQSRLFPLTERQPSTAFTFDVLDHFHALTLTSQIAAYDYVNAMARITDAMRPGKVITYPCIHDCRC